MKTRRVPKRLGDVGRFETRIALTDNRVNTRHANYVMINTFEESMTQLNERIARLEARNREETQALSARCEETAGQLNERISVLETNHEIGTRTFTTRCDDLEDQLNQCLSQLERKFGEEKKTLITQCEAIVHEVVQRPPQETPLSTAFSGNGLEVITKGMEALKRWTGMANATTVYNSAFDGFTANCLFDMVRGKPNIAIVGFTEDGDVFGGFYGIAKELQGKDLFDPTMFAFSFESHGRCLTPQRFPVKEKKLSMVEFVCCDSSGFVSFFVDHVSGFSLGDGRSDSLPQRVVWVQRS